MSIHGCNKYCSMDERFHALQKYLLPVWPKDAKKELIEELKQNIEALLAFLKALGEDYEIKN